VTHAPSPSSRSRASIKVGTSDPLLSGCETRHLHKNGGAGRQGRVSRKTPDPNTPTSPQSARIRHRAAQKRQAGVLDRGKRLGSIVERTRCSAWAWESRVLRERLEARVSGLARASTLPPMVPDKAGTGAPECLQIQTGVPGRGEPADPQLRHRGSELASGDTLIVNRRFVTECSRFAIPRTMRNPAWWL
jgi:hypothetical protein